MRIEPSSSGFVRGTSDGCAAGRRPPRPSASHACRSPLLRGTAEPVLGPRSTSCRPTALRIPVRADSTPAPRRAAERRAEACRASRSACPSSPPETPRPHAMAEPCERPRAHRHRQLGARSRRGTWHRRRSRTRCPVRPSTPRCRPSAPDRVAARTQRRPARRPQLPPLPMQRTEEDARCGLHQMHSAPKCLPVHFGQPLVGRLGVRQSAGRSRSACPRLVPCGS